VPAVVAVIVAVVSPPTADVLTMKAAEVAPCGTVRLGGTTTFGLSDERLTMVAAELGRANTAVPCTSPPAVSARGTNVNEKMVPGFTVPIGDAAVGKASSGWRLLHASNDDVSAVKSARGTKRVEVFINTPA
jgi:hypothetical protein